MKHPILGNRTLLIIWYLVWLLLALGQGLLFYYNYGNFATIIIVDSLLLLLLYSGIALSIWYPFSFFNNSKPKPLSLAADILATGAISILLWILITKMILQLLFQDKDTFQLYWDATIPYRIGFGIFVFTLIILSYYLLVSLYDLSQKNAKEARLESLVKETELKMLRSQINPHFLFNSLNSISSLTVTDPEKAREMVIKLSDFMRYSLSRKDELPVTLASEMENLRLYFEIEKVRFGDRLTTEEKIDGNCLEIKVPVMILQPIYENAVKHGVYESTGLVTIKTEAQIKDGFVIITICNNYENGTSSAKGTGTGISNVSRRLELFYGSKASLRTSKENGIFTATIFIPV